MRNRSLAPLALLLVPAALSAQRPPDIRPYLMADRAAEIALARTAAPASVSAKATVLVLGAHGYVEAAKGTNGFTCAVMRSFAGKPTDANFWTPSLSAPHCFNPPASRSVLPAVLARAEWALAGATPAEMTARTKAAYAGHRFSMPATGAMAYMLSPKQHLADTDPHWMPHLMFYYDRSVSAATFGAGGEESPILDATGGDASSPIQVIYIPTHAWADGTVNTHKAPGA